MAFTPDTTPLSKASPLEPKVEAEVQKAFWPFTPPEREPEPQGELMVVNNPAVEAWTQLPGVKLESEISPITVKALVGVVVPMPTLPAANTDRLEPVKVLVVILLPIPTSPLELIKIRGALAVLSKIWKEEAAPALPPAESSSNFRPPVWVLFMVIPALLALDSTHKLPVFAVLTTVKLLSGVMVPMPIKPALDWKILELVKVRFVPVATGIKLAEKGVVVPRPPEPPVPEAEKVICPGVEVVMVMLEPAIGTSPA